MTAYEAYEEAIENGEIPASILVENMYGDRGLATVAFEVAGNSHAEQLTFSSDPKDRALAAIFACQSAGRSLARHREDLKVAS